ncbi:MAG: hypothetical protein KA146_03930 [Leptospiraceae bacterium]|nr:hypothetical protein [Leptospiraceae bacterium]
MKILILFIVILCSVSSSAKIVLKGTVNPKKWSKYQGEMNWDAANRKCFSLGMKLPTRKEIKAAYKSKETNSWMKDGVIYWTSEIYSEGDVCVFNISDGTIDFFYNYYAKSVICIEKEK